VNYSAGAEQFTLAAATDVRVGFFTQNQGSAILALDGNDSGSGSSTTSHDNDFAAPTGAGESVAGFSHPNIGRTYAFEINVSPVPEPSAFFIGLLGVLGLAACRWRRNRT